MLITKPAMASVLEQLSPKHKNLLLIGEDCQLNIEELIEMCQAKGITIAGGIFPGVIHGQQHHSDGIIIKQLPPNASVSLIKDISTLHHDTLRTVGAQTKSAMVLVDGLSRHITGFLEHLFETYWDRIKFIGGGAGSLSLQQQPCLFTNEGFFENAAIVILQDAPLNLGVKHGWKKIAGPFVVNSSTGNTVHELNWRPAFEVYQEIIQSHGGRTLEADHFFEVAKCFPFGLYREGMEDIVRDPIITDGQSLTCVGEVPVNSVVNILVGEADELIRNAEDAAGAITAQTTDTLIIDCISRSLFLEEKFTEELAGIERVINTQNLSIPLEGVLSLGEISSYGDGYLEFFNKTIVVGAFQKHV